MPITPNLKPRHRMNDMAVRKNTVQKIDANIVKRTSPAALRPADIGPKNAPMVPQNRLWMITITMSRCLVSSVMSYSGWNRRSNSLLFWKNTL